LTHGAIWKSALQHLSHDGDVVVGNVCPIAFSLNEVLLSGRFVDFREFTRRGAFLELQNGRPGDVQSSTQIQSLDPSALPETPPGCR
jgi:hypothetical protein